MKRRSVEGFLKNVKIFQCESKFGVWEIILSILFCRFYFDSRTGGIA